MVDPVEFLLFIYFLVHIFHVVRKAVSMALCTNSPTHASPPPPSPPHPALSWKRLREPHALASKRLKEASDRKLHPEEDVLVEQLVVSGSKSSVYAPKGCLQQNLALEKKEPTLKAGSFNGEQVSLSTPRDFDSKVSILMHIEGRKHENFEGREEGQSMVKISELDALSPSKVHEEKAPRRTRKRPAKLVIPETCVSSEFAEASKKKNAAEKELEVEGSGFCLVSRRGQRHVMEDGYGVITNVHGDSKQAFFGVFDGHGGRAAVDFVSKKLGKNIIAALDELDKEENQLELAIRSGYLATDKEFLSQGVSSGACAATAFIKEGELHVANVGDCRVVMCKQGVAQGLTRDHRAGREDERIRIESSGGYVSCRNGVWRVMDSLAVSRAIGDANMKEWIISEPETNKLRLTPDCEFLIMASDGLWDKVTEQEAVDVVTRCKNSLKSCKDLVDISCSRGNRDDTTVMVVDLQRFVQLGG
ncbi:probable protein phosphatase 2C 74 [Phoenix dactylifera]|uniref:protein-serine/threonine phosphatase n=1 Tax=Phoenix dactylifera TaxID=42345 RepID=A0A8B7BG74_PHODC|nr:probable protein phosphatase 2C 74 [Phoenix dactylifera]